MMRSVAGVVHSTFLLRMILACGNSRVRMTLESSSSAWKPPEWVTKYKGVIVRCASRSRECVAVLIARVDPQLNSRCGKRPHNSVDPDIERHPGRDAATMLR